MNNLLHQVLSCEPCNNRQIVYVPPPPAEAFANRGLEGIISTDASGANLKADVDGYEIEEGTEDEEKNE